MSTGLILSYREIFLLIANRKVYQPNTMQVTEQLFAQVRCFQHSQLRSPLLHHLKKSWGSPRFHSNLICQITTLHALKIPSIFLLPSTLLHFGQATSLNSVVTPTAHLLQQGAQSTAKQNAQYWELSHKNTMVLGNTSVDKCLQNLLIFIQTKQPLYFFQCIKGQLNRSYTPIDNISITLH